MKSYLEPLVRDAAADLGPGTCCSVIVAHDGVLVPGPSSDRRSAECDAVEIAEGAGPCILSMAQLRGVLVGDVTTETRWDPWRTRAVEAGFRSAAAMPAHVSTGTLIALNLYSDLLDPWDGQVLIKADEYVQEMAVRVRSNR